MSYNPIRPPFRYHSLITPQIVFLISVLCSCLGFAAPPPLKINEIQAEGGGLFGDAVEIFNPTNDDVDLEGWQLVIYNENDLVTDTLVLPKFLIPPEGYLVVSDANQANTGNRLYFPSALIFWQANEAGACALLDPDDAAVDFVRWDGSAVATPTGTTFLGTVVSSSMNPGTTLGLNSKSEDTDKSTDWCLRPATLGSPNEDECLSDVIRITELSAETLSDDQIELHNSGSQAHNIGNLQLQAWNQNDQISDTVELPNYVLEPGGYVILSDSAGTNTTTTLFLDALIFWQANEAGACALLDGSTHGIDFVRWDGSAAPVPPGTAFTGTLRSSAMNRGTSLSRNAQNLDLNQANDWCLRPSTFGAQNIDECLSDVIRINEIATEGAADLIELYNSGTEAHNIGNLQLRAWNENNLISDTVELPNYVLQPGGYVILSDAAGTDTLTTLFLDALIFWQANEPGACALLDGSIQGIDFVRWDASTAPPPIGTSFSGANPSGAMTTTMNLVRRRDGLDRNRGADWAIRDSSLLGPNGLTVVIQEIVSFDLDNGRLSLLIDGLEPNLPARFRSSNNLTDWNTLETFTPTSQQQTGNFRISNQETELFFRIEQP